MNRERNDEPAQDPVAKELAERAQTRTGTIGAASVNLGEGHVPFDEASGRWADDPIFPQFCFSDALRLLKTGGRLQRVGWNGKGMWIAVQVPDAHSKMSLPYIYMKTADDKLVPWLASQTDILADDWQLV